MTTSRQNKMRPLREKLLISGLVTTLVSFSFVGVLVYFGLTKLSFDFRTMSQKRSQSFQKSFEDLSQNNVKNITESFKQKMNQKGKALIQKDSSSIATFVEDNAFQAVREFLKMSLQNDSDIISASFFSQENQEVRAWQYVSSQYPEGLQMPIEYISKTQRWNATDLQGKAVQVYDPLVESNLALTEPSFDIQELEIEDASGTKKLTQVFVCITPIYRQFTSGAPIIEAKKKGEAVGYLRYVLSLAGMENAIFQEKKKLGDTLDSLRKENESADQESIRLAKESIHQISLFSVGGLFALILFAYVMSRRASARVTRPIQDLTLIAENMAGGNYRQEFEIDSDDEIGLFADAFRKMSVAITKRDEELAEINRNLEKLVQQRTSQLNEQLRLVSDLLNNMKQAVFSVSTDMKVVAPVSKFAEELFGESIVGRNIFDVVYRDLDQSSESYSNLRSALASILGSDELQWMMSEHHLVRNLAIHLSHGERTLKMNYQPILNGEGLVENLMYVVEDITDILVLERKIEEEKDASLRRIQVIQELARHESYTLAEFFKNSNKLISELDGIVKRGCRNPDEMMVLLRNLHTLKGNARSLGFTLISSSVHHVESEVITLRGNFERDQIKIDKFAEKLSQQVVDVKAAFYEYSEMARKVFKLEGDQTRGQAQASGSEAVEVFESQLDSFVKWVEECEHGKRKLDVTELRARFDQLFTTSFKQSVLRYIPMVQEISDHFGKQVGFRYEGADLMLNRKKVAVIYDAIGHILRNALEHGIEEPKQREAAGKSITGTVVVEGTQLSDRMRISLRDDGRGIDGDRVVQSAIAKGLITLEEASRLSLEQRIGLIFLPGLSTQEQVSEISGRGIGMDAVREMIHRLGGTITVDTQVGIGTQFLIDLKM